MRSLQKYFPLLFLLCMMLVFFSCGTSNHSRGPKEYIEKNGLHSDKKPSQMAQEQGEASRRKKRAYRKQLAREWKKKHPGEPRRENPYRHKLQK